LCLQIIDGLDALLLDQEKDKCRTEYALKRLFTTYTTYEEVHSGIGTAKEELYADTDRVGAVG